MGDYLTMTIERAARLRDLALAAVLAGNRDRAAAAIESGDHALRAARIASQAAIASGEGRERIAAHNRAIARIASESGEIGAILRGQERRQALRAAILADLRRYNRKRGKV